LVALMDDMESRGLIERRENRDDRRRYALHVTDKGCSMLDKIGQLSREHSQALLNALSDDERALLGTLLQRIADEQGLTRGVHPGFSGL
jgi:DNA-binding MarR family transcriptional regulator